jgi:putative flippase GtrA
VTDEAISGPWLARTLGAPGTHRFLRFAVIGGFSFGVDIGVLWLMHSKLGVSLSLSTTCGYALGFTINFYLNRGVTFASDGHVGRQGVKYLIMVGLNYLWTLGIVWAGTLVWRDYLISKVIASATYSIVNFFGYKHWVFGQDALIPGVKTREEATEAS